MTASHKVYVVFSTYVSRSYDFHESLYHKNIDPFPDNHSLCKTFIRTKSRWTNSLSWPYSKHWTLSINMLLLHDINQAAVLKKQTHKQTRTLTLHIWWHARTKYWNLPSLRYVDAYLLSGNVNFRTIMDAEVWPQLICFFERILFSLSLLIERSNS